MTVTISTPKSTDKVAQSKSRIRANNCCLIALFATVLILNIAAAGQNSFLFLRSSQSDSLVRSRAAVRFKAQKYLSAEAPDILVLGSSLPMCALYYSEGDLFSARVKAEAEESELNLFEAYTASNFLENQLSTDGQSPVSVFNFTTAACMVSDIDLICSRIVESGRLPEHVILGLGLRDFVDKVNPPFGQTPVFKELIDLSYLISHASLINENTSNDTKVDLIASATLPIWKERTAYRLFSEQTAARILDRNHEGNDLASPDEKSRKPRKKHQPSHINTRRKLSELDYYRRYNPPAEGQFRLETESLRRLLELLTSHEIKTTLINMPVTQHHKVIANGNLRKRYRDVLRSTATEFSIAFLDFENDNSFTSEDFLDTVHLAPVGAKKFVLKLAPMLRTQSAKETRLQ